MIGNSGALLHGFPDTTRDTTIFVRKAAANGRALVNALRELRFPLDDQQAQEIEQGKDFIQLRSGPFDMDIVFAPDGIETFDDAWSRGVEIDGIPVCSLDDIIERKRVANRPRDRELLPRLEAFRQYQRERTVRHKVPAGAVRRRIGNAGRPVTKTQRSRRTRALTPNAKFATRRRSLIRADQPQITAESVRTLNPRTDAIRSSWPLAALLDAEAHAQ